MQQSLFNQPRARSTVNSMYAQFDTLKAISSCLRRRFSKELRSVKLLVVLLITCCESRTSHGQLISQRIELVQAPALNQTVSATTTRTAEHGFRGIAIGGNHGWEPTVDTWLGCDSANARCFHCLLSNI